MHRRRQRAVTALTALVVAGACADTDATSTATAWSSIVVSSCAVKQIASSDPDMALTRVEGVDVDSRGRIYIADPIQGGVTVLSPEAKFQRRIGRHGKGPGEFKYVRTVQILPGDSLLVYDVGLGRISVYAPDSSSIAYQLNIGLASNSSPPNRIEKLSTRSGMFAVYRRPYVAQMPAGDKDNRTQTVRVLESDGSIRVDSVLVVAAAEPLIVRTQRAIGVIENPFSPAGLLRLGPDDRMYFGWGDSVGIAIYAIDGHKVGGFALPFVGSDVTEADVTTATAEMERVFASSVRKAVPERWPAFRNFVVDSEGRVWLGLLAPGGQPTQWTAFTENGSPVCSVALPSEVDLKLIRGQTAYAVATDESGVPQIRVYRLLLN